MGRSTHHTDVELVVDALVLERVEEGDDVGVAGVVGVGGLDGAEELDLVEGGFGVSARRFHDFESDVGVCSDKTWREERER